MVLIFNLFKLSPSIVHSIISDLVTNEIQIRRVVITFTSSSIGHLSIENLIYSINFIITFVSHLNCFSVINRITKSIVLITKILVIIHSLIQFRITQQPCFHNFLKMYLSISAGINLIKKEVSTTFYLSVHFN